MSERQKIHAVLKDTLKQIREAQLPQAASSLSYTTILSIIPLLAVSFSIFQAFGGLDKLYGILEPFILEHLAEGSSEQTIATLRTLIGNVRASTIGITGFVGLVFTSMAMRSSVERAVNQVWRTPISRKLFSRITSYWFFITLGPLSVSMVIGFLGSEGLGKIGWLPSAVGVFLGLFAGFFAFYKWVPHRHVHVAPASIAALMTTMVFLIARASYGIYTSRFVSYNKLYGSLAAIPILLVWIYICWLVVLGGAALSATIQRRFDLK